MMALDQVEATQSFLGNVVVHAGGYALALVHQSCGVHGQYDERENPGPPGR
jgi:hypothetical protein